MGDFLEKLKQFLGRGSKLDCLYCLYVYIVYIKRCNWSPSSDIKKTERLAEEVKCKDLLQKAALLVTEKTIGQVLETWGSKDGVPQMRF